MSKGTSITRWLIVPLTVLVLTFAVAVPVVSVLPLVADSCAAVPPVSANADAWIDQNSSSTNKGTDSILKVQSKGPTDNFRALVRFSLPPAPQGCTLESATLRLFSAS